MRTIPTAVQTALESGSTEYIVVLQVFWGRDTSGPSDYYGDRAVDGTPIAGKIINQDAIDQAVQVSGGGQAASFNVVLDDTDGSIKTNFNTHDVQKVPVKAWFYVIGTDFDAEKVEIFEGQINSPFVWDEGQRTVNLSVVNKIEDVSVGFSAEEGAFPHLPEDLIGRTWPLCFGTTINIPALKAIPAVSGQLAQGVGIADFTLAPRLKLAEALTCPQTPVGLQCVTRSVGAGTYSAVCNTAFETDANCLHAKCVEIEKLELQIDEQTAYEYNTLTIFGGKNFPQGRDITLNIQGGLFRGYFDGTKTNPSNTFRVKSRQHPKYDPTTGKVKIEELEAAIQSACPTTTDAGDSDFTETAYGPVFTGLRTSRIQWEEYRAYREAGFFWAGGGSTVVMQDRQEIVYIANIVPSTILRVSAWRTVNGNRFLLTVPSAFYTVRQVDYNGYQVMEIVFNRPLSSEHQETGGGWTDDIYVSQISTVGPNTVDIIEWMINTYTNYSVDSASFTATRSKVDKYPMHFPLLSRPNLLSIMEDLAQKARCAIWLKGSTVFIKYLADEPTTVATIDADDILTDDANLPLFQIEITKTEDLTTELVSSWKKDYSVDRDNTLILRANVGKYGTHRREEDYFPFAHLDLVRKSSTFWLIRWANTWKRVRLAVSLEFLKLEPFDAVLLDLPQVADNPVKCVVERATLNTEQSQIDLELWAPVRAGEMSQYNFAFPAGIYEKTLFPTIEARNAGEAGSSNEPNFSVIAPPGHPLQTDTVGVYQGINLGCNGIGVTSLEPGVCRQDHGDGHPSDIGDVKPTVDIAADVTGNVSGGTSPITQSAYSFFSAEGKLAEWAKKTEGDSGRAREGAELVNNFTGATDSETSLNIDQDFLANLPDPDDLSLDQYPCQIRVLVHGFKTGPINSKICAPSSDPFGEIYVFDSEQAAQDFCDSMNEASNCSGKKPCGQCTNCTLGPVSGSDCDPPGPGNMIGYRPGPDPSTSFAF